MRLRKPFRKYPGGEAVRLRAGDRAIYVGTGDGTVHNGTTGGLTIGVGHADAV
jgi:hypothetical protein